MRPCLPAGRTFAISDLMSISVFQLRPTQTELMLMLIALLTFSRILILES